MKQKLSELFERIRRRFTVWRVNRAPDGRVIKDVPLFVPVTPAIQNAAEFTYQDFALVAARRMHEARMRDILMK